MSDCYIGDAICSFYGFANVNGNNTLKVRLDTLFIKNRESINYLPLNFNEVTSSIGNLVLMTTETAKLSEFLLNDVAVIDGKNF